MSTTLTNMNETTLVNTVLDGLSFGLVPIKAFSLEVETTGKVINDIARVPVVTSNPTAQTKTPGTDLTSNGTIATTPVTLSTFKEAKWQLNEGQISAARFATAFNALARGAAYEVSKVVVDAAFALIVKASTGDAAGDKLVCAPGDFGQTEYGQLLTLAAKKKIGQDRTVIMNAEYAGSLLGQSSLGAILATMGSDALKTGIVPNIMGMNSLMYADLSDNSEALGGFVAGKTAVAAAIAPPELLAAPGQGNLMMAEIITNTDSSVACLLKVWYDAGAGTRYGSISVIYGAAFLQNSVVRIVNG